MTIQITLHHGRPASDMAIPEQIYIPGMDDGDDCHLYWEGHSHKCGSRETVSVLRHVALGEECYEPSAEELAGIIREHGIQAEAVWTDPYAIERGSSGGYCQRYRRGCTVTDVKILDTDGCRG